MATGTWPRADAETGKLAVEPLWNQGSKITLENLVNYPTMKANQSLASLIFHLSDWTEYVVSGNSTSSEKTVTIENPFLHTQAQALTAARLILVLRRQPAGADRARRPVLRNRRRGHRVA